MLCSFQSRSWLDTNGFLTDINQAMLNVANIISMIKGWYFSGKSACMCLWSSVLRLWGIIQKVLYFLNRGENIPLILLSHVIKLFLLTVFPAFHLFFVLGAQECPMNLCKSLFKKILSLPLANHNGFRPATGKSLTPNLQGPARVAFRTAFSSLSLSPLHSNMSQPWRHLVLSTHFSQPHFCSLLRSSFGNWRSISAC